MPVPMFTLLPESVSTSAKYGAMIGVVVPAMPKGV